MLVIGSTAMAAISIGDTPLLTRTPQDIDFICTHEEMTIYSHQHCLSLEKLSNHKWVGKNPVTGHLVAEFELTEFSESGRAYVEYVDRGYGTDYSTKYLWSGHKMVPITKAPPEVLYSIKLSHRHYPQAWKKHIEDLTVLKRMLRGYDHLSDTTKLREKETALWNGPLKTPSLAKTKERFFDDNVSNRLFVHDEIHQVMAYRELPMFTFIKKDDDPNSVACSKEKFFALPLVDQYRCVLEESYVIALERCILPMLYEGKRPVTSDEAWDYAIMRICTTLCSGWFRQFATMYYAEIKAERNPSYVRKFLLAVHRNEIQRIKEAS